MEKYSEVVFDLNRKQCYDGVVVVDGFVEGKTACMQQICQS